MKNNIIFKFIAILLCAASLLGTIGGITGVVVMAEGDLYNKTADQIRLERMEQNVLHYSEILAQFYASAELGGCPQAMLTYRDNTSWFEKQYPVYGYRILDAEGTVLSSHNEHLKDTATSFTVPTVGQYLHLVSTETETEIMERELQKQREEFKGNVINGQVPDEGICIDTIELMDANGNLIYTAYRANQYEFQSVSYGPDGDEYRSNLNTSDAGYLYYGAHSQLTYTSFLNDRGLFSTYEVAEIFCVNEETGFTYRLYDPNGIGTISAENGKLHLVLTAASSDPAALDDDTTALSPTEETICEPTAVPQTIPPTTESVVETSVPLVAVDENGAPMETTAQETPTTAPTVAAETTPVETTAAIETVPSSASAVPDETSIEAATEATIAAEVTESVEVTEATTAPTVAQTLPPETLPPETLPEVTEPVLINGKTLDNYQINTERYWDNNIQDWISAKYVYIPMPALTVELYVDETSMRDAPAYNLLELLRQYSDYLLPLIGSCLLIFAIFAVYLCTAAGRRPKTEYVCAGGLNRLPLDLYFFVACFMVTACIALGGYVLQYLIQQDILMACGCAVGMFFLACLIFVSFCFAFVAQIKTPDGFWYRNTLLGHTMRLTAKFAVWLEIYLANRTLPFLKKLFKWLWNFTCKTGVWCYHAVENSLLWLGSKFGRIFRWIVHQFKRFFSLLPLTWQWLLAGFFVVIVLIIGIDAFKDGHNDFAFPVALLITFAVIFYGAHCFGVLFESTKRMSKGDLGIKVKDDLMVGCFDEFSSDLNALADVAVVAAQKQLKSERMKTELITNVSHDIKTPLTSIINYVDLLQKPHTDEEEQQYLEVLDRQSQRLKKLIDDLMDMSKANTGNMQVDITRVDAVESVNQALGEFADKLDRARLVPVFRHEDSQVPMMADGKLVWRVLSNLLGNAVKYAMPGTRLYIDLAVLEGNVIISLKNISREELNIDADELMERFVRGDDSRNTEGSGLGLNIAKSLMELQKGQLQLLVDGDLFKVTLIFPGE